METREITIEISESDLRTELTNWMIEEFGNPREMEPGREDKWHERNGLINHFIRHIFNDYSPLEKSPKIRNNSEYRRKLFDELFVLATGKYPLTHNYSEVVEFMRSLNNE